MNDRRAGMSLDEFMSYGMGSGGGRGYLKGWKKDGELLAWLHTQLPITPFWNHPLPIIKEIERDGAKEMAIFTDRWGCLEHEVVLRKQYFRKKDGSGAREMPPVLCPMCLLSEWVFQEVRAGNIDWTDPLFQWSTDDDELIILAGGVNNQFRQKDMTREQKAELRRAKVDVSEAWKQDMRAREQFLLLLVNDSAIDDGVQKTFEGKGLAGKLQQELAKEMKRSGREKGNPALNPYPFKFEYDEDKNFDDKYSITAMTGNVPSAQLLEVLASEPPNIDDDVKPGDCWALRAMLEEHTCQGIVIPWDRIFAPATKKGLMKPAQESKADATDFDPAKLEAEEKAEKQQRARTLHEVRIETNHPVWQDDQWKPEGPMRGTKVLLDVPEGTSDDVVGDVTDLFEKAGAVVGEIVQCDHCREPTTTLDDSCPHCGSKYSDNGTLISRPCLKPGCVGQCDILSPKGAPESRAVCSKCGTIHEGSESRDAWKIVVQVQAPAPAVESSGRRRRGGGVPFDRQEKPPF